MATPRAMVMSQRSARVSSRLIPQRATPCAFVRSTTRGTRPKTLPVKRPAPHVTRAEGQVIVAPRTEDLGGDPFGLLLKQRIVFLGGEVNDFVADAIVSQLLLLDSLDATKDIKLFINSPGVTSRKRGQV